MLSKFSLHKIYIALWHIHLTGTSQRAHEMFSSSSQDRISYQHRNVTAAADVQRKSCLEIFINPVWYLYCIFKITIGNNKRTVRERIDTDDDDDQFANWYDENTSSHHGISTAASPDVLGNFPFKTKIAQ